MTDQPPAVTLTEWAERHSVKPVTARKWASQEGQPLHGRAWLSAGVWLIRPDEPVPPPRLPGRPKREAPA